MATVVGIQIKVTFTVDTPDGQFTDCLLLPATPKGMNAFLADVNAGTIKNWFTSSKAQLQAALQARVDAWRQAIAAAKLVPPPPPPTAAEAFGWMTSTDAKRAKAYLDAHPELLV